MFIFFHSSNKIKLKISSVRTLETLILTKDGMIFENLVHKNSE